MKLVTYRNGHGQSTIGAFIDQYIVNIPQGALLITEEAQSFPNDMIKLLEQGNYFRQIPQIISFASKAIKSRDVHTVQKICVEINSTLLLPPVLRPTKVIGCGMNYYSFVAALGEKPPKHPELFHKTCSALNGDGGEILVPYVTDQPVPEGELAIIIGKRAKFITPSEAPEYIAGFACANDISAKNLEFRGTQWTSGKMLETFCPLGPALVTIDEISDVNNLSIRTTLNGREIQRGNTSDMIIGVYELVAQISSLVTLEVGDVLLTGTPSDLGAKVPPVFLQDNDVISVQIEEIGKLTNRVRYLDRA